MAGNGRGKSTLLACLAGAHDQIAGDFTYAHGVRVAYVKQDVPSEALARTLYSCVLAALPADRAAYESWRVDVVLDELRIPNERHRTRLSDLSPVAGLERWLAGLPHHLPVILTSHDRAFWDATTNRAPFLRPDASQVFPLPFTAARAALDEADAADEWQQTNDLNKARQLRCQAAKLKNVGINSRSDLLLSKTKHLTERADRLEASARTVHKEHSAGDIELANNGTHAKVPVTLNDVSVETPDGWLLFRIGRKWIVRGDRVVVLGRNGAGKTQLVKAIRRAGEAGDMRRLHRSGLFRSASEPIVRSGHDLLAR